jgi:hypothetical protein
MRPLADGETVEGGRKQALDRLPEQDGFPCCFDDLNRWVAVDRDGGGWTPGSTAVTRR